MVEFIANILASCASFSWWFEENVKSFLMFGEIPYPTEDE